jgi:hypothetical protein
MIKEIGQHLARKGFGKLAQTVTGRLDMTVNKPSARSVPTTKIIQRFVSTGITKVVRTVAGRRDMFVKRLQVARVMGALDGASISLNVAATELY